MAYMNLNRRNPKSTSMILLVTCLMAALIPDIVRAGDLPCSFCPSGIMLPDPNKIIALTSTSSKSCGELQEEASKEYLVKAYGCDYYKYYAHLCGCPPRNLPQRCGLCQGAGEPTYNTDYGYQTDPPFYPPGTSDMDSYDSDEEMDAPYYPVDPLTDYDNGGRDPVGPPGPAEDFYPDAPVSRKGKKDDEGPPPPGPPHRDCRALALEAMYDPFNLGCGHYFYLGTQCGCPYNKPRSDGCDLCVSGADPAYGKHHLDLAGELPDIVKGKGTCQEVADYTEFSVREGSSECISKQMTLGNYCGCFAEAYDGQQTDLTLNLQPKPLCPLCPNDDSYYYDDEEWVIKNERAPTFSYLNKNGDTVMYQSGATCLEAETLANELLLRAIRHGDDDDQHQICYGFQEQLTRECCKKVPKGKGPKGGPGKASHIKASNLDASTAPSSWKSTSSAMFLSAMLGTSMLVLSSAPW